MKILPIVSLLVIVVCAGAVRAQDEGEARSPASRGLLKRGLPKGKTTTTTTTPAPQDEVEYEDDADYAAEEQEPSTEAPPSSTEGKKLVAGGVRPFRSNTDLLETLKRRRAQAAEQSKHHGHSPAAQPHESPVSEAKSSYSKKRINNPPPARESNNEEAPAPAKPIKGRFGRPVTRAIQEADAEEQADVPAPTRNGRGFRRGNY